MSDYPEKLREGTTGGPRLEIADYIEKLEADNERLRTGLHSIRRYYIPADAPTEVWCGDENGDLPLTEFIDRLLAGKEE